MITIDTQMLVYSTLPSEHTALAVQVHERDSQWVAPPLWRSEFRNAVAGYLRSGRTTVEKAERAYADAQAVLLSEHLPSNRSVLDLISSSKCTAYDLEFVAVAKSLGIKLVTNDKEVLAAFPETAVSPADFVS